MVQKLQWLPAEIEAWFFSHNIAITNDFKQADGNICIETSDGLANTLFVINELLDGEQDEN